MPKKRGHNWSLKKKQKIVKLVWQEALNEIYDSLGKAGALSSSPSILKKELQKRYKITNVSINQINEWLQGRFSHSIHKFAPIHFKRNPIIAPRIHAQWQADLCFMDSLSRHNKGFKIILVAIDVVSRFAWVELMKTKSAISTTNAFKSILEKAKPFKPEKLQTDKGTEFLNHSFQTLLKQNKIDFFTSYSDTKAAIAERFVKTIKTLIYKYLNENNTLVYWDKLQLLVDTYNATEHSATKYAPSAVSNENENDVLTNLYGFLWETDMISQRKPKFKIGDFVRISRKPSPLFRKGYKGNWSDELLIISEVKDTYPRITYGLKDFENVSIFGSYYDDEIQLIPPVDMKGQYWDVENIVKTRTNSNGIKEYLVKWKNKDETFNTWIPAYKFKQQ
jgi:transposase InsO family protein